jgi:hypothetical protein
MEATVRVALPSWLAGLRPLHAKPESWGQAPDVTALLEEWALAFADPIAALQANVGAALGQPGWTFGAKATLTQTTARLVREAVKAQGVEAAIRAALGNRSTRHATIPVLVGVAVVTAVEANIGKAASDALLVLQKRDAVKTRAAAERERQRSAPAAAEVAAARPTLSPMPDDAFGEAAR